VEKKNIISLCDSSAIFNFLVLFSIKEKQKKPAPLRSDGNSSNIQNDETACVCNLAIYVIRLQRLWQTKTTKEKEKRKCRSSHATLFVIKTHDFGGSGCIGYDDKVCSHTPMYSSSNNFSFLYDKKT